MPRFLHELLGELHDVGPLGRLVRDERSASSPDFKQAFFLQGLVGPKHRVNVHAKALGQLFGGREFVPWPRVTSSDRLAELSGKLIVQRVR